MTRSRASGIGAWLLAGTLLGGCTLELFPTPSPPPAATESPVATASPASTPSRSATPGLTVAPSPTQQPLSLALPEERDERRVRVAVANDLPLDGDGTITVTVASLDDEMIDELVLRWPEGLHATLFPAPFEPSADRIRDGAPPLIQDWTKWVLGPGERGEPAGTVSLGYGPLPGGGTLEIPLHVTRRADGPVAFDLQVLAGEALLTLEDGAGAQLRIAVP